MLFYLHYLLNIWIVENNCVSFTWLSLLLQIYFYIVILMLFYQHSDFRLQNVISSDIYTTLLLESWGPRNSVFVWSGKIKTGRRVCSAVRHAKHRVFGRPVSAGSSQCSKGVMVSRGWVGIGVCCSYMKGAKWKMTWGAEARAVFTVADTKHVCFMTPVWAQS